MAGVWDSLHPCPLKLSSLFCFQNSAWLLIENRFKIQIIIQSRSKFTKLCSILARTQLRRRVEMSQSVIYRSFQFLKGTYSKLGDTFFFRNLTLDKLMKYKFLASTSIYPHWKPKFGSIPTNFCGKTRFFFQIEKCIVTLLKRNVIFFLWRFVAYCCSFECWWLLYSKCKLLRKSDFNWIFTDQVWTTSARRASVYWAVFYTYR